MANDTQWLTPPEVAKRLRVKPDRVLRWIRSGQLAGVNVGDGEVRPRFRVSGDALERFLAGQAVGQPAQPSRRRRQAAPQEWY